MSYYAARIAARPAKAATPAAPRQATRPAPASRSPLAQVLQLRAARDRLEAARPVGEVVQCKLKFLGVAIHPLASAADPVPDALAALDAAPTDHHIRDDWDLANHGMIHVLDGTRKYLLGETHGSGDWEDETARWRYIRKMSETEHMMPESNAAPPADRALPLESKHPFLMSAALLLHEFLNGVMALPAAPAPEIAGEALFFLNQICMAYAEYDQLITPARAAGPLNGQMTRIATFRDHFKATYLPAAERMRADFTAIKAGNPVAGWRARINADRAQLPVMGRELRAIAGIGAQSARGLAIEAVAAANQLLPPGDALKALNPVREQAMARNINAAAPPLLVQLGDMHIEPLVGLVPGAVGLRKGQMLAEVTALDLGPAKPAPVKPGPAAPAAKPASKPPVKAVALAAGSKGPVKKG